MATTYDGTTLKMYLNGQLQTSQYGPGTIARGTAPLRIGSFPWSSNPLAGGIDDVRLYDRALTAFEVSQLAQGLDPNGPLQVTAKSPAPSASGVRYTPITATFSAPIDLSTLTAGTIWLETSGGTTITTNRTYDSTSRTVTLTPTDPVPARTVMRVRVKSGSIGVKSVSGALMTADVDWTYFSAAGNNLAAAYAFAETTGSTTIDDSGNGNTGTLLGPTRSSGTLLFDGVDDQVRIEDADTLDIAGAITMSAKIRLTAFGTAPTILAKQTAGGYSYVLRVNSAHKPEVSLNLGGNMVTLASATALTLNTTRFIAATYDGATIKLYVDATMVASTAATGAIVGGDGPFLVGGEGTSATTLTGTIDDVRLYDRALTSTQVSSDRTTGVGVATPPPPVASPRGSLTGTAPIVTLTALSGSAIRYTTNGTTPSGTSTLYVGPVQIPNGTVTLKAVAFLASVSSATMTEVYTVDTVPPTIVAVPFPGMLSNWMNVPVTITFQCADAHGIASCSSPVTVSQDGAAQQVSGQAIDSVGNQSSTSILVGIDRTPPQLTLSAPTESSLTTNDATITLSAQVSDTLSGVGVVTCNGSPATVTSGQFSCDASLKPGRNSLIVQASDLAGNNVSLGVEVTRIGSATTITMAPATRKLVVNDAALFELRDDFGATIAGATWTSSDDTIVTVSTDDPPLLTAIATGTVTITASKNGLEATASIDVLPGTELPEGTTRWEISPRTGLTMKAPIYTNRTDETVPDLFLVEESDSGETSLRAAMSTGETLWIAPSPGIPIMGDSFGGVVTGVPFQPGWTTEFSALVRVAGPTPSWRYQAPGSILQPAQAPDGTMFALESMPAVKADGTPIWDKHVVVLNGASGTLLQRLPLDREVCHGPLVSQENPPATFGPVVGTDGRGYLLVRRSSRSGNASSYCSIPGVQQPRGLVQDQALDLIILSPNESFRVYRRALSERGWSQCPDEASMPRSCVNVPSGWCLTTPTSIPRNGPRFDRSRRS